MNPEHIRESGSVQDWSGLELELVSEDDFEGEHEELDDDIKTAVQACASSANLQTLGPLLLAYIVQNSKGRLDPKYENARAASQLINEHEKLGDMLIEGFKSGFRPVRLCKLLRAESTSVIKASVHAEPTSIEKGWDSEFTGNTEDALWKHICYVYAKYTRASTNTAASTSSSTPQREYYARYCMILQSSGMGKSRTVDEMSKKHFVIPIVLRDPGSTGHPPSDQPAYKYLLGSSSQYSAFIRSCGFLHALFFEMAAVIEDLGDSATPYSFREYMRKDMKFQRHGKDRVQFYKKVTNTALELTTSIYESYFRANKYPSSSTTDAQLLRDDFPLCDAFRKLCSVIRRKQVLVPQKRKRKSKQEQKRRDEQTATSEPLIVVAFDEIRTLIEGSGDKSWTCFNELRRAVRGLRNKEIFTLFLSTSGAAFDITPTPARDRSARMAERGDVMLPFCELGFDQLAEREDFSKSISLTKVTSLEHLMSYGRPLWKSCYAADGVIKFAVFKLLGGSPDAERGPLSIQQQLACLAQRIPIEFLSTTYPSQISSDHAEKEQVHSHLRVPLKIEDDLETMVTTSPSEPLLSEAAYFLMTSDCTSSFSPAEVLQNILNGFAVNKGELGELLVALLFTIARDKAVGPADEFGQPPDTRWCLVPNLLRALFHHSSSPFDVIGTSSGWRFSSDKVERDERHLAEVFKDSKAYFTHFIKAQEKRVLEVKCLMRLMARGAGLLCAAGQTGVDGVIPFLLKGDEIKEGNIGAIMFQVKDDKSFTDEPNLGLIRKMNPRTVIGLGDIPVIRIFFALAATRPALKPAPHIVPSDTVESYTAYDFWAAGFSSQVFPQMSKEEATWKSILQGSRRWGNIYQTELKDSQRLRKIMNPGVATSKEHWTSWGSEVTK